MTARRAVLRQVAEAIQQSKYPRGRLNVLKKPATPADYRYAEAAINAVVEIVAEQDLKSTDKSYSSIINLLVKGR